MVKNNFTLITKIIELSEANNWEEARKEWEIKNIYENRNFETCLCNHFPIKEIIVIINSKNNNITRVGNCCINRFFEIKDYNKFFNALRKNKINIIIIEESFKKELINEWEKNFLINVFRKRKLTEKQNNKREELKQKILKNFKI